MTDEYRHPLSVRSSAERMKFLQSVAKSGVAGGVILGVPGSKFLELQPALGWALIAAGAILPIVSAVPFARCKCPQCGGKYHGFLGVFRDLEKPPPCRCCGFRIDKHISRY